jgi:hypothetical protein
MFKDTTEQIEDEVRQALEVYSLDDILDYNDITLEEAITKLIIEGHIELPEVRPVR